MRYLIALTLPPLALLICGKPLQALINFILEVVAVLCALSVVAAPIGLWLGTVTVLHAVLVAHSLDALERQQRLERILTPLSPPSAPESVPTDSAPPNTAKWEEMYGAKKKSPLSWLS